MHIAILGALLGLGGGGCEWVIVRNSNNEIVAGSGCGWNMNQAGVKLIEDYGLGNGYSVRAVSLPPNNS